MSEQDKLGSRSVSRRDLLNFAALGSGAVIAITIGGQGSAAPKKFTQQQAKYQAVPKNGQRCQTCSLWQSPTSCQVVEGAVSPAGWCMLYQPKS